jgi:hypothetical protein
MADNVDLLYLTNHHFLDKYNKKQTPETSKQLNDDINFYRKRIFSTTKDLLRGNTINNTVDQSFYNYAQELINHFKFIDKKDILQQEYLHLKEKPKKQINPNFNLSEKNQIMTRETKNHIKTIKDYIPITIKTKKKKQINYPKKKEIDIKNPKFRIKGLEKEKSKQIICQEKQKDINQNIKEVGGEKSAKRVKNTKSTQNVKNKKKTKKTINLVAEILENI